MSANVPTHERPEARLLLTLARPHLSQAAREGALRLIEEAGADLDWGFILDTAGRHKILALAAKHLLALWPASARLPHRALLDRYRQVTRLRNEAILRELELVLVQLDAAGIHPML